MFKIILQSRKKIVPFNEPARDLRILNKPLWLAQRDVLAKYTDRELELPPGAPFPQVHEPCLVYRDNLYFDDEYIRAFIEAAQAAEPACRGRLFRSMTRLFASISCRSPLPIPRPATFTWPICGTTPTAPNRMPSRW